MVLQAIRYTPSTQAKSASLEVLDQLLLPHSTVYNQVVSCEDGFDSIKQMRVRGAPAIAIVAALALAVELSRTQPLPSDICGHIVHRLEYLKTSRPTAVNLGDAVQKLSKIVKNSHDQSKTNEDIVQQYIQAAENMLVSDVSDNKSIGFHGAQWILTNTHAGTNRSQDTSQTLSILTICNTGSLATAGYGTALGVIRALHGGGHLTNAYACETRPYNQGSRLTAYELVHDQIPATLITDSMAASLLRKEGRNIAAVVVGADRVAANGDTANKIGTYSLAVLARYHGVKFLVAAPRTTIDLNTASGAQIVIEERPAHEVTRIRGPQITVDGSLGESALITVAADGIDVWNPAFDVTPAELIDGVITEVGVVTKVDDHFDFSPIFNETADTALTDRLPTIGGS